MKKDTRFANILLKEAKRVYGENFDFDECMIIKHDDGTYQGVVENDSLTGPSQN